MAALCLDDARLLKAVAGRRADELAARHAEHLRVPPSPAHPPGAVSLCVHDERYPASLRAPLAPRMLHIAGARTVLADPGPVVALLGSRRASDYGAGVAASIARGLAASGVAVVSGLSDGVAAAALDGALEGGGAPVAVLDGGLGVVSARMRGLGARVARRGAMVSELEPGCKAPRWGELGSLRTAAALADAVVLIEAGERPPELAAALLAGALGRPLGAVPGRVTSPLAAGTNALLAEGAALVRDASDVLELLGAEHIGRRAPAPRLERRLRDVLERVAGGQDTLSGLTCAGEPLDELLSKLSELELAGLLGRGHGARYVVREPLEGRAPRAPRDGSSRQGARGRG